MEYNIIINEHHTYTPNKEAIAAGIKPFNYFKVTILEKNKTAWDGDNVNVNITKTNEPIWYAHIKEYLENMNINILKFNGPIFCQPTIKGQIHHISYFTPESHDQGKESMHIELKYEINSRLSEHHQLTDSITWFGHNN